MSASPAQAATTFVDKAPIELPQPVRMRILLAVMMGIFLAALDQFIVGTALPRVITELSGNELYAWAFTAYLLTATISGPLYGKLSDLFGRRPIFLFGIGIFLVGSVLAALSQSMPWFVVARGVQGLGAGALFPIALAIIGDIFAPSERGKYQGLFGAVFGVSVVIGPAVGGVITDTIGWPWVFIVNLPVGAVSIYLVWRYLPRYHLGGDRPSIDYVGAALFAAALVPFLLGLQNKATAAWTDGSVSGLMGLGILIAVVFLFWESRAKEPIVPLSLFRIRTFTVSITAIFLAAFGFFATFVYLPRWFQVVNGSSATESGYQILPMLGGLIISAVASGQIVARTGRYRLLTFGALVTMAVGLFLLSNLKADTPIPMLWLWMFIAGLGVGPTFAVFTLVVQNGVPVEELGTATSGLTFWQQVGGTVGLAIAGTIFASTMTEEVPRQIATAQLPPELAAAFGGGQGGGGLDQNLFTGVGDLGSRILATMPEQARAGVEPFIDLIVGAIYQAISISTAATFQLGIIAALVAAGVVLLLREQPFAAAQEEAVMAMTHEAHGTAGAVRAPESLGAVPGTGGLAPMPVVAEDEIESNPQAGVIDGRPLSVRRWAPSDPSSILHLVVLVADDSTPPVIRVDGTPLRWQPVAVPLLLVPSFARVATTP